MSEQSQEARSAAWTRFRAWLRRVNGTAPCDRCGVEGGLRWRCEERVGNRIVSRALCSECDRSVFFYPWRDEREWVR